VVTGSEIVGLVPFQALYEAGRFYLRRQGKSFFVPVADVLESAVFSMGLNDVAPFDIDKKVLGLPKRRAHALAAMSCADFADEVSRDTPAPGGGSVAALAGALGAALAAMVANLTHAKAEAAQAPALLSAAEKAQRAKEALVLAVDEDASAFNAYMEARRLPQGTPEERATREAALERGLKSAVDVPWATALASLEAMEAAAAVIEHGLAASISDGLVGLQVAFAGVRGGVWNVLVNLKDIADETYCSEKRSACKKLLDDARSLLDRALAMGETRLAETQGR
jgi:glutamate formiminotransferase/formiminotetrahydrofolate cyclodeaminase